MQAPEGDAHGRFSAEYYSRYGGECVCEGQILQVLFIAILFGLALGAHREGAAIIAGAMRFRRRFSDDGDHHEGRADRVVWSYGVHDWPVWCEDFGSAGEARWVA